MKIYNAGFHLKPGGTQYAEVTTLLGDAYDYPQQHPDCTLPMCITWGAIAFADQVGLAIYKDAILVANIEPVPGLFAGQNMDDALTMVQAVEGALTTGRGLAGGVAKRITLGSYAYPLVVGGDDGMTTTLDFNSAPIAVKSTDSIRGCMRRIIANSDVATVVAYRQSESMATWKAFVAARINQTIAAGWGKPIYAFINASKHGPANGIANYSYHSLADWLEMLTYMRDTWQAVRDAGQQVNLILWDGWYSDDLGNFIFRDWVDGEDHFLVTERFHDPD